MEVLTLFGFSIPFHLRAKRSKTSIFEQPSVKRFSKSKEYDMQKKNGFSYIEILVALALFSIVLFVALPLAFAALGNLDAAKKHGQKNLAATGMGLAVRDMLQNGTDITSPAIQNYAQRFAVERYSVFIFRPDGTNAPGSPFHFGTAGGAVSISGFSSFVKGNESLVVVVLVMNDFDVVVGKSVHLAIDYDKNTGLMRRFYE